MTFKNFSNSLKRALNKIIKINTITSLLKPFTIQDKATSKTSYRTSLFLLQDMHKGLLGYRRELQKGCQCQQVSECWICPTCLAGHGIRR